MRICKIATFSCFLTQVHRTRDSFLARPTCPALFLIGEQTDFLLLKKHWNCWCRMLGASFVLTIHCQMKRILCIPTTRKTAVTHITLFHHRKDCLINVIFINLFLYWCRIFNLSRDSSFLRAKFWLSYMKKKVSKKTFFFSKNVSLCAQNIFFCT